MTTSGSDGATQNPAPVPAQPAPPAPQFFLECISGPDMGKRVKVVAGQTTIGRSADCNLLSDDADVADVHVTLSIADGRLAFAPAKGKVFVDGQVSMGGTLGPGQQVRMGRSVWQLAGALPGTPAGAVGAAPGEGFFGTISGHITRAAGMEQVKGFSFQRMFAEVFRKRTPEEVEQYFIGGTSTTTPALKDVDTSWPRPWVFARIFAASLIVAIGFYFAVKQWPTNHNLWPGLMIVGALAVPFSILILFFEFNILRNVSLFQVVRWFATGGIISLIITLFFFQTFPFIGEWLGKAFDGAAMAAGPIEETAKGLTVVIIMMWAKGKYRYTLNGLLFGACVGCGFQVFESAGYALRGLLADGGGVEGMLGSIRIRGTLSIFGMHTLWTALVGAGLWKVCGDRKFTFSMLGDMRVLRLYFFSVGMHMLWNSPIGDKWKLGYAQHIVAGVVGWIVVMAILQDGLNQVRKEQQKPGSGVEQPRPGEMSWAQANAAAAAARAASMAGATPAAGTPPAA
ncbi:MAG: PrsW family intramembrane metalloprotease [Phycisphaerae bacterium]|nr:PrsW family intramembrane metalloprotease [Phycisphaerae bacterium]